MNRVIEISNLTKHYGKSRGVEDVSLYVEKGDIFGFLGPNGAGKSTTIRCMLGLIRYEAGDISLFGMDAVKDRTEILRKVGYMPGEAMFYPTMKVSEVIKFAADTRGMDCSVEAAKLCERLEVDTKKRIEELSLGNRKKVSIVCAMQHKPELFIFDEPTSGLDPLMQAEFFQLIQEYNKEGASCFLSSHVLSEVSKYCNKVAIVKEGKMVRIDTIENLSKTNAKRIKIRGIQELALSEGVVNFKRNGQEIELVYNGKMPQLIQALQGLPIEDILIEEPSLEEIFMHFYEREN